MRALPLVLLLVPLCAPAQPAELRLTDFGADPTGERDSAPAFETMWAAAGEARNVHLLVPAGRYRLSRCVTLAASGNATNYGLPVQGAGEDVAELWVDNAEGGLRLQGSHISRMTVTISDLSIVALREPSGSALSFDTANPGDQHSRQFSARDILIRGERFDQGGFAQGVVLRNAWYPRLDNVKISGMYGPALERDPLQEAIVLEDCYSPLLSGCYVWNARDGLVYRGGARQPEDGSVRDCYFVGCRRGVTVQLTPGTDRWEEPAFHMDTCHINYLDYGLMLYGVRQVQIRDCLFYCHDMGGAQIGGTGPARDFEPIDIDLRYASDAVIGGNIFTEPSNPRRLAVRIGPDSGYILLRGNQFNHQGTAIRNESSLPSFADGNVFGGRRDFSRDLRPYDDRTGTLRRGSGGVAPG